MAEGLRPRIQEHVDGLLSAMEGRTEVDLVREYAYPLVLWVLCELLGIPKADWEQLSEWAEQIGPTREWVRTTDLARATFGTAHGAAVTSVARSAFQANRRFRLYLLERIREHEAEPTDDLLSALISAELDGAKLSRSELIGLCMNLLFLEPTVNLIGNGALALLRHPEHLRSFVEGGPASVRVAVDELMRFDAPVQLVPRTALQGVEIRGVQISRGQHVVAVVGAANRDPARFSEPDRLDLVRSPNRHLAFSSGIHRCIGAPLGHAEAEIALHSLFRRFPRLRLTGGPIQRRDSMILRGPRRLPVCPG